MRCIGNKGLGLAGAALVALFTVGCDRLASGPGAEQREANYIAGQNYALQGQRDKAIGSFEQAVLVNPSNAAAHLALGDLFYGQHQFINAAYHYGRYLELLSRRGQKPDLSAVDSLRNCEMQIAVKFSRELSHQQNDQEIEALNRKIAERESLIRHLQAELLQRSATPFTPPDTRAQTPAPMPTPTPEVPPAVSSASPPSSSRSSVAATPRTAPASNRPTPSTSTSTSARGRVHVVRAGENPSAIARRYGISVHALLAANPGVNPRRMSVGAVLRVP